MVFGLLRHGPTHVEVMRRGLERWMEWRMLATLDEARGRESLERTTNPATFIMDRGSGSGLGPWVLSWF